MADELVSEWIAAEAASREVAKLVELVEELMRRRVERADTWAELITHQLWREILEAHHDRGELPTGERAVWARSRLTGDVLEVGFSYENLWHAAVELGLAETIHDEHGDQWETTTDYDPRSLVASLGILEPT